MAKTIKAIIPGCKHTIELRNCKEVTGHDDSLPFNADIYVNGKPAGRAWDDGWGGETDYRFNATDPEDKKAIDEIQNALKKIACLKDWPDSPWNFSDLFGFMAEKCICYNRNSFIVKPQ